MFNIRWYLKWIKATEKLVECDSLKRYVNCVSPWWKNTQGWTNLFLGTRLFSAQINLRAQLGMQLNSPIKTKVHVLDTTRNIAFCSLLSKYPLQPSFLICFHQKFTQWDFYYFNVVLTSKIRCASKSNLHNSNLSV